MARPRVGNAKLLRFVVGVTGERARASFLEPLAMRPHGILAGLSPASMNL
jgi:hypothetical protein